jgi:hypothetical protein
MTLVDGGLVHIVVLSELLICPAWNLPAVHDEAPPGTLMPAARVSIGNRPTTVAQTTDCDGRRPVSRTTIA